MKTRKFIYLIIVICYAVLTILFLSDDVEVEPSFYIFTILVSFIALVMGYFFMLLYSKNFSGKNIEMFGFFFRSFFWMGLVGIILTIEFGFSHFFIAMPMLQFGLGGILGYKKKPSDNQKSSINKNQCLLCHDNSSSNMMNSVPKIFIPGAHIIYSLARYTYKNMYFPSLKFFIGPIFAIFEVKGNDPVCTKCRRLVILSSIAIYLSFFGFLFLILMDVISKN